MKDQEHRPSEHEYPKDLGRLLLQKLDELAAERGTEHEEQVRVEKTTGTPLPAELILYRRLAALQDLAGNDMHRQRELAILRYASGINILSRLIQSDAELTVAYNRHVGRPDTETLLVSGEQEELVDLLKAERSQLRQAFPTLQELPLSERQQDIVQAITQRVGLASPAPASVSLEVASLAWPSLRALRESATVLAAAGPERS